MGRCRDWSFDPWDPNECPEEECEFEKEEEEEDEECSDSDSEDDIDMSDFKRVITKEPMGWSYQGCLCNCELEDMKVPIDTTVDEAVFTGGEDANTGATGEKDDQGFTCKREDLITDANRDKRCRGRDIHGENCGEENMQTLTVGGSKVCRKEWAHEVPSEEDPTLLHPCSKYLDMPVSSQTIGTPPDGAQLLFNKLNDFRAGNHAAQEWSMELYRAAQTTAEWHKSREDNGERVLQSEFVVNIFTSGWGQLQWFGWHVPITVGNHYNHAALIARDSTDPNASSLEIFEMLPGPMKNSAWTHIGIGVAGKFWVIFWATNNTCANTRRENEPFEDLIMNF